MSIWEPEKDYAGIAFEIILITLLGSCALFVLGLALMLLKFVFFGSVSI